MGDLSDATFKAQHFAIQSLAQAVLKRICGCMVLIEANFISTLVGLYTWTFIQKSEDSNRRG